MVPTKSSYSCSFRSSLIGVYVYIYMNLKKNIKKGWQIILILISLLPIIGIHAHLWVTYAMAFRPQKSSEVTGGQKGFKLKKSTKEPNIWLEYSYNIPDQIGLGHLTSKVIRGHWRSKRVQFWKITMSNICYSILTPNKKRGQIWKISAYL